MTLRLTKRGIRVLTARYRAVLLAALIGSLGATNAMADSGTKTLTPSGGTAAYNIYNDSTTDEAHRRIGLEANTDGTWNARFGDTTGSNAVVISGDSTSSSFTVGSGVNKFQINSDGTVDIGTATKAALQTAIGGGITMDDVRTEANGGTTTDNLNTIISNIADTQAAAAISTELGTSGSITSAINTAVSGKTTLSDVVTDAGVTTSGHLGAAITSIADTQAAAAIAASVADTTTDGALGKLLAGKETAGAAAAVETKLTAGATGYDINAKSLQVQGKAVLTTDSTVDVAKIDITNYDSSALKTAVVGTKVTAAGTADSAKAVTSDAIDDSTIKLDGGKLKVGTIAQSQVTGLETALTNIAVTVTGGVATIHDDTTGTADVYTKDKADSTFAALGGTNIYTGTNTFNNAAGIKIQDGSAANDVSLTATNKGLNVSTALKANGNISTENKVEAGSLEVTGASVMKGDVTIKDGDTAKITLGKDGNITTAGTVKIGNAYAIDGSTTGTLDMKKNSLVGVQGLTLTDGSSNTATLSTNGTYIFTGNTGLDVGTGDLKGGNLGVSNNATIGGTLGVTNNATIGGKLSAGATTVSSLKIGTTGDAVTSIDQGSSAITSGNSTTLASTATVLKSAENATYSGTKVVTASASTTLTSALSETTAALNNVLIASGTQKGLVDDAKVGVQWNSTDKTLEAVLGNGVYATENNIAKGDSMTAALSKVDAAIGNRASLGSANAAINTQTATSVAAGLKAAGDAIGTVDFSAAKNTSATNLTTAVSNLDTVIGDMANVGNANGNLGGADIAADLKKIDANMGNLNVLTHEAFGATAPTNITSGLNSLATNVATATGGTFTDGAWAATVTPSAANSYTYTASANLMDAINQVAGNVGTKAQLTDDVNGVKQANSVNQNIEALNTTIGDMDNLNKTYVATAHVGNAITNGGASTPATVVAALNNIDATLGMIHGLKVNGSHLGTNSNLATGTTVEDHLVALDDAIGNRNYTSTNYVTAGDSLSTAVSSLDDNLNKVEGRVSGLEERTKKMNREMKAGFASVAAMSALVPNARSAGDTQVSLGTGYYRGTAGFALGAFHHFNDNVMMNVGAGYSVHGAGTFRAGVTFGF